MCVAVFVQLFLLMRMPTASMACMVFPLCEVAHVPFLMGLSNVPDSVDTGSQCFKLCVRRFIECFRSVRSRNHWRGQLKL